MGMQRPWAPGIGALAQSLWGHSVGQMAETAVLPEVIKMVKKAAIVSPPVPLVLRSTYYVFFFKGQQFGCSLG